MVEVVGWGKNKQRTPSTWSDAVCRRVQFPTPFWRVTYSFSIFVRLCSGAPSARPNCLLLLQEEEEISFLFYFLPSSQSDRVQSCSRRIVVFNKSYSSFLISSPLLFEQKCYGYCSRRHKKTKKKKNFGANYFSDCVVCVRPCKTVCAFICFGLEEEEELT